LSTHNHSPIRHSNLTVDKTSLNTPRNIYNFYFPNVANSQNSFFAFTRFHFRFLARRFLFLHENPGIINVSYHRPLTVGATSIIHNHSSILRYRPGVGNLLVPASLIGYLNLCRGPQKKIIISWTVSETLFLVRRFSRLEFNVLLRLWGMNVVNYPTDSP
jgi:hypothetical protein